MSKLSDNDTNILDEDIDILDESELDNVRSIYGNYVFTITEEQLGAMKNGKILSFVDEYGMFIKLDNSCTYEIIFDENSRYWLPDQYEHNITYATSILISHKLKYENDGYLYLRYLLDKFSEDVLSVNPTLGWDKNQHPNFEYKIVESPLRDNIKILVNPIKLK